MVFEPRFGLRGRKFATFFILVTMLSASVALRMEAQTPASTTMAGIYTTAQADRGEETYMGICVACHPAGTYTTDAFKATWEGRPLSDLFSLISTTMPKSDPASLSPEEYSQVVAYILKINNVPPGKTDLPTEAAKLKAIKIEMPAANGTKKK
jgi:mono/diheme cytochrome c family protein